MYLTDIRKIRNPIFVVRNMQGNLETIRFLKW